MMSHVNSRDIFRGTLLRVPTVVAMGACGQNISILTLSIYFEICVHNIIQVEKHQAHVIRFVWRAFSP